MKFVDEIYSKSKFAKSQCVKPPSVGNQECIVTFKNGSFIKALPFGAGSGGNNIRGERFNAVYIDEYASIDDQIIKLVVEPMLTVKRNFDPTNPEDSMNNRIVIFSSAYYTWNHFYKKTQQYLSRVKQGDEDYYVAIVDYKMPLKYGLYDEKAIAKAQRDNTQADFEMEYGAMFQSEGTGTWIPVQTFDKRVIFEQDLEPQFEGDRNKEYGLYCDYSISQADGSDNTTFLVCELDHTGKVKVVRIKAVNGMSLGDIENEIRQFYLKFNLKEIVMDGEKLGLAIKGYLENEYKCPVSNLIVPPLLDVDDERNFDKDGEKIVKLMKHRPELNHNLGLAVKRMIEQRRIAMPVLTDRHDDPEIEMAFLEMIALKKEVTNIKAVPQGVYYKFLQEKKSRLKRDRWTVFSYCCFSLENRLNKEDDDDLWLDVI